MTQLARYNTCTMTTSRHWPQARGTVRERSAAKAMQAGFNARCMHEKFSAYTISKTCMCSSLGRRRLVNQRGDALMLYREGEKRMATDPLTFECVYPCYTRCAVSESSKVQSEFHRKRITLGAIIFPTNTFKNHQ